MLKNLKVKLLWMDFKELKVLDIVNGIILKFYLFYFRADEVIYPAPWILDEKFLNDH